MYIINFGSTKVIHDDGDVDYMFRLMIENNMLHLCICSSEVEFVLTCNSVICLKKSIMLPFNEIQSFVDCVCNDEFV